MQDGSFEDVYNLLEYENVDWWRDWEAKGRYLEYDVTAAPLAGLQQPFAPELIKNIV